MKQKKKKKLLIQIFKSTSKNGIFGIYAIIDQIHLRIPLKSEK
jgi:hypothetical protein